MIYLIFELNGETKAKFKILVLAFVKEVVLIRIKTELSSFKTLRRDRFENFHKIIDRFEFFSR